MSVSLTLSLSLSLSLWRSHSASVCALIESAAAMAQGAIRRKDKALSYFAVENLRKFCVSYGERKAAWAESSDNVRELLASVDPEAKVRYLPHARNVTYEGQRLRYLTSRDICSCSCRVCVIFAS